MTTLRSHQTHRPIVHTDWTDLNRTTSARYDACVTNGGHHPSGEYILRDFSQRQLELPICSACGVPYGGPQTHWASSSRGGRG